MLRAVTILALATISCSPQTRPLAPLVPLTSDVTPRRATTRALSSREDAFSTNTRAVDVDHDGRPDLVREYPAALGDWARVPFAVVAHGLADGGYAIEDDVTRAALRGVCPAPSLAVVAHTTEEREPAADLRAAHARSLFVEGVCRRVWGAFVDDAVEGVRASARASSPGIFSAPTVDAVVAALRAWPVPLELAALSPRPVTPGPAQPSAAAPAARTSDPRCAVVQRANATVIARAIVASRGIGGADREGLIPLRVEVSGGPACLATSAGVWSLRYEGFAATRSVEDPRFTLRATLRWSPATGRAPTAAPLAQVFARGSSERVDLEPAGDIDGDGAPEVFVRTTVDEYEGVDSVRLRLFSQRGGVVAPYASAAAFPLVLAGTDADADGRADLVLPTRWPAVDLGDNNPTEAGPSLLAHALPDGTFSTVDAVARAWTIGQCHSGVEGPPFVACARLLGMSAEEAVAAYHRRTNLRGMECTNNGTIGSCVTFAQVAATALVPLPFTSSR